MQQHRPLNRAQRRARRTTALAGAGLALTASLVGLYPGGTRVPRAYAEDPEPPKAPPQRNCNVSTWEELKAAVDTLNDWSQDKSATLDVICSTITFTADISDVGVPMSTYENGYTALLNIINIPDGETVTILGQGNTLDFSGDYGNGFWAYALGESSFVVDELEISGKPYFKLSSNELDKTSPSVWTSGSMDVLIEDSWIHGHTSPDVPAVRVEGALYETSPSLSIVRSEFSDNTQGAVSALTFDDEGPFVPDGPDVTITSSYFHDNATNGAYGLRGGALTVAGSLTVTDSTFADNTSTAGGGAIDVESTSTVTITNSTFRNNTGVGAGSLYARVADPYDTPVYSDSVSDDLVIDHSTFLSGGATGTAGDGFLGKEVLFVSPFTDASMALTNSVFWGGIAPTDDVYWYGAYSSEVAEATASISNSVFQLIDGQTVANETDNVPTAAFDPADLTWGDHGGTVLPSFAFADSPSMPADPHIPTFLPAGDSSLIDAAGPAVDGVTPPSDQRGVVRPQGDAADIGSVEVERLECMGEFTAVGAFDCVVPDEVTSIDVLVVGGGGGGGAGFTGGGGGGGGEVRVCTIEVTPGETLPLEVAAGGFGAEGVVRDDTAIVDGTDGASSSVADCIAAGGKGGRGPVLEGGEGVGGDGGASGNGKAGGVAKDLGYPLSGGGGGGAGADGDDAEYSADDLPENQCTGGAGGAGFAPSEGAFAEVTTVYGGGGGGGNGCDGPGGEGGDGGGGDGGATNLGIDGNGQFIYALATRGAANTGGGGGGGANDYNSYPERGPGAAGGSGYVEIRVSSTPTNTTVIVTPPSPTITYGGVLDLTPTDDLPDGVSWVELPTCKVYPLGTTVFDASTEVITTPVPAGKYIVKCAGGTLPSGYTADVTATGTLTVNKATATLNYTGTSGVTLGSSITLSGSVSPSACTSGIVYKVDGVTKPEGSFSVVDGQVYEIEMSYVGPNCDAASMYAVVLVGGTASASNGGGWYNVQGVGRVNFGYTVQINKSRTGSTQVSGQMLWNSQNGKFRFKGVISGFTKTMTGCSSGQVCGRIIGTGTLRTRNELGEWIVVGVSLPYKAAVIDAGTASVCTGGKKKVCSTVNKPDFFGLDVAGPAITGEQRLLSTGFPTPVQLSGGNLVIK